MANKYFPKRKKDPVLNSLIMSCQLQLQKHWRALAHCHYKRQLNDWLHNYLYKKEYPIEIGKIMRDKYEKRFIRSKNDFEEALKNVLSDCER